ncbi:head DNA stabilization protein, partial [Salmonella enterica subsp. enterica serovar Kentucky]|nr:head DNA stabilization protein [Salmonella enterica subsp. enterica serovar Kentucky]
DSDIPAWADDGVALKLAVQVCMDNVIQPSDALLTAADSAYQTICIALTKIPPLERRNDMPRGSGNKSAFTWNRFYIENDDPSTRGE